MRRRLPWPSRPREGNAPLPLAILTNKFPFSGALGRVSRAPSPTGEATPTTPVGSALFGTPLALASATGLSGSQVLSGGRLRHSLSDGNLDQYLAVFNKLTLRQREAKKRCDDAFAEVFAGASIIAQKTVFN